MCCLMSGFCFGIGSPLPITSAIPRHARAVLWCSIDIAHAGAADYLCRMAATTIQPGVTLTPGYLDRAGQEQLLAALRANLDAAPLYTPRMPKSGKPMSVRMSNCGPLGWVTDEGGYRYQPMHPQTGAPWPPMPEIVCRAWQELACYPHAPEACLVNVYGPTARMGLHQDRDE